MKKIQVIISVVKNIPEWQDMDLFAQEVKKVIRELYPDTIIDLVVDLTPKSRQKKDKREEETKA